MKIYVRNAGASFTVSGTVTRQSFVAWILEALRSSARAITRSGNFREDDEIIVSVTCWINPHEQTHNVPEVQNCELSEILDGPIYLTTKNPLDPGVEAEKT